MKTVIPLLVCLLALTTALASAQESRWSVGAHFSSFVSSDMDGTDIDWGLTARYHALSFLSIQGRFDMNETSALIDSDGSFELSALLYPYRTGVVDVYASVGGGFVSNSIEDDILIRLGGGFDVPINSSFSFFTDFRFLTLGENEIYIDDYRIDTADEIRTSIGFNYRF